MVELLTSQMLVSFLRFYFTSVKERKLSDGIKLKKEGKNKNLFRISKVKGLVEHAMFFVYNFPQVVLL